MIKSNSEIINKLFFKEIQSIVNRYNSIDKEAEYNIELLIENIEDENLKEYVMSNPKDIFELSKNKVSKEEISLIAWCMSMNIDVSIEFVSKAINDLNSNTYVEIDDYVIYKNKYGIEKYAQYVLDEWLGEASTVEKLFDSYTIAEMWINQTSKDEMIEEIIHNQEIEEVLEIYPQDCFSIDGEQYKYSQVDNT